MALPGWLFPAITAGATLLSVAGSRQAGKASAAAGRAEQAAFEYNARLAEQQAVWARDAGLAEGAVYDFNAAIYDQQADWALSGGLAESQAYDYNAGLYDAQAQFTEEAGAAEAAAFNYNAGLLEQQAADAAVGAQWDELRSNDAVRRVLGTQRAAFGRAGVTMEGTPTEMLQNTAEEGALETMAIRFSAAQEIRGLMGEAAMARFAGAQAVAVAGQDAFLQRGQAAQSRTAARTALTVAGQEAFLQRSQATQSRTAGEAVRRAGRQGSTLLLGQAQNARLAGIGARAAGNAGRTAANFQGGVTLLQGAAGLADIRRRRG